ncbi:MAG: hypothetical protein ACLUYV_03865 [Alistipes shahii]
MAELTSQAYSQGGNVFRCPGWMRVTARDVNDPFDQLPAGARGGLNIADLASWWSCAFIQTQDGALGADGACRHRRPYRPFGHPGLQSSGCNEMPAEISAMTQRAERRSHGVPPWLANPPHP